MVRTILILALHFLYLLPLSAQLKLPSVLSDNMVLQQQSEVKIWGWATKGATISVTPSWNNEKCDTQTSELGKWELTIPTPSAGGPYEIKISAETTITLHNILIGEVWFCSGQSNMEMPMKGFPNQPVEGSNDLIASAKSSTPIRMFIADSKDGTWLPQQNRTPQEDIEGSWYENTSEAVANTSATAYFYAQYLQKVLDVPVGIIVSTLGGSCITAWMSEESLTPYASAIDLSHLKNDIDLSNPTGLASVLYNGKVVPFLNYNIKGFLWYQGERNRGMYDLYTKLAPDFVADLRKKWNKDFPFFFVEIAPFVYDEKNNSWLSGFFRETQQKNRMDIPNSGMVSTLDIGDAICIHPPQKESVGKRLAYLALGKTYGKKGVSYDAPTYKSQDIEGNKILLNFDKPSDMMWQANQQFDFFEIAGSDKVFYPAKVYFDNSVKRLVVSSNKVPKPVAVRYAFRDYTGASLFSVAGIPVSPFRTDNW